MGRGAPSAGGTFCLSFVAEVVLRQLLVADRAAPSPEEVLHLLDGGIGRVEVGRRGHEDQHHRKGDQLGHLQRVGADGVEDEHQDLVPPAPQEEGVRHLEGQQGEPYREARQQPDRGAEAAEAGEVPDEYEDGNCEEFEEYLPPLPDGF